MPEFKSVRERIEYEVKNDSLEELIHNRDGMRVLQRYIEEYPEMLKMVSKRISELRKETKLKK
jgi:hypothetical protein